MLEKIIAAVFIFLQSLFSFNIAEPFFNTQTFSSQTPPIEESFFARAEISPLLPIRHWEVPEIEIDAAAAIALDINSEKILYQKNIRQERSIASLTKLVTASVILENAELDDIVTISKNAVETYGEMGNLIVKEKISIKNLLYILLMESSNDAAVALSEYLKEGKGLDLVSLMNQKTKDLGLEQTFFSDPSGLNQNNISSGWDIAQLTKYTLKQNLIWDILQTNTIDVSSADNYIHRLNTTNKLLQKFPEMIGGKTGYTEEAGECMISVIKIPEKDGKIILVILGAKDRFAEMEKLINWVEKSYVF